MGEARAHESRATANTPAAARPCHRKRNCDHNVVRPQPWPEPYAAEPTWQTRTSLRGLWTSMSGRSYLVELAGSCSVVLSYHPPGRRCQVRTGHPVPPGYLPGARWQLQALLDAPQCGCLDAQRLGGFWRGSTPARRVAGAGPAHLSARGSPGRRSRALVCRPFAAGWRGRQVWRQARCGSRVRRSSRRARLLVGRRI